MRQMGRKHRHATRAVSQNGKSSQAAVEFLSVYGFAILGIAVISILLYVFIIVPSTAVPNQCSFPGYLTCKDINLGSNSVVSRTVLVLSDSQQYALMNATATINITDVGAFSGACSPSFILPGGLMECIINFNKQVTQNQIKTGQIYLSATVCTTPTQSGCGGPVQQTYGGTYMVHVTPLIPPPQCSISLSAANSTQMLNQKDTLTANVKILDIPVAGATVNFTTSASGVTVSPQQSNTDSNGNATSYAFSASYSSANITASFSNCTASASIDFVNPIYLTFDSNVRSSSTTLITIDSSQYTSLPRSVATSPGASHTYAYASSIPISSGTQYGFNSISGCGLTSQSGSISSTSNCSASATYVTQYYLNMSAGSGGSVSPSSEWVDSGLSASISATPNTGYYLTSWTCTGTGCYSGTSTTATVTMDNPITETASFADTYTLTAAASPSAGGTVSGGGTYNYNSAASLSATAGSAYTFSSWSCSGTCPDGTSSTSNPWSVTVTGTATYTANFQSICGGSVSYTTPGGPYSVTVPAGCSTASVQLLGAGGGGGGNGATFCQGPCYQGGPGGAGGTGASVSGTISVTPGETLYVWVGGGGVGGTSGTASDSAGGAGGTNGGGGGGGTTYYNNNPSYPSTYFDSGYTGGAGGLGSSGGYYDGGGAAGGGGFSAISLSSSIYTNGITVAGGGGGGGAGGSGGSGGAGYSSTNGGAGGSSNNAGSAGGGSGNCGCGGGAGTTSGAGSGGTGASISICTANCGSSAYSTSTPTYVTYYISGFSGSGSLGGGGGGYQDSNTGAGAGGGGGYYGGGGGGVGIVSESCSSSTYGTSSCNVNWQGGGGGGGGGASWYSSLLNSPSVNGAGGGTGGGGAPSCSQDAYCGTGANGNNGQVTITWS